ncbi:histidine phosphatase family protein [Nakamurella sp. A5-74]|uniref:Histidine phosphatase family protein n=1 Tax=Nakamurella sp. A5-74 TaxID=3158264 RepID=A0AAU8DT15_9ACTN
MSLHRLVLLRHGETDWNAEMRLQGHRDIPLNERGLAQAQAAAPSVAGFDPDLMMVSDLQRARQTAAPVAGLLGTEPTPDVRLRETSMGQWEGLTRADVDDGWPDAWDHWRSSIADVAPPDGETRAEVADRAREVVDELITSPDGPESALLVSHGGLIVGLTALLLDLPRAHWHALTGVSNCHWVELELQERHWRLRSYNAGLSAIVMPAADDEVAGV